jgi:hypothetical protein
MRGGWEAFEAELDLLEAGEVGALEGARSLVRTAAPGAEQEAWSFALASVAWFWRAEGQAPSPDIVRGFAESGAVARRAAGRVCRVMAKASLLALDPRGLGAWLAAHEAVRPDDDPKPASVTAARCWLDLLLGRPAVSQPEDIRLSASRAGDARGVIEATALGAMVRLSEGNQAQALVLARRAALMARTEAFAELEVLTGLLLARVRRHTGRPHLALHVLSALIERAPSCAFGWLSWEIVLSGGAWVPELGNRGDGESLVAVLAARALARLLPTALTGDRAAFDQQARRLLAETASCTLLEREARMLLAALDGTFGAEGKLAAWRHGETSEAPAELQALMCLGAGVDARVDAAYVVADPGEAGVRVLRAGIPLFRSAKAVPITMLPAEHPNAAAEASVDHAPSGSDEADQGEGREQGISNRALAGLAALLLAGARGLAAGELFRRVYGFAFVPELHAGTFRVLLHRMRSLVASVGEIWRRDDELGLTLNASVAVADPRSAVPPEMRLVMHLAAAGGASTEAAARNLQIPVRTLRDVLRQLVESGLCRPVRDGRRIVYQVQDTVLTQLTPMARTGKTS